MSMSTHVIGFAPPDAQWQKMKDIWDACKRAGIGLPEEVVEFFNGTPPDERGVEVEINATKWQDDSREGFEISVADIPEHVKLIRFYNSW